MPFVDAVMWVALVVCAALTARGLSTWRSGGQEDANVGIMGALAPANHLLAGVVQEEVRVAFLVIGLVLTLAWRLQLSRRARERAFPRP